MSNDPCCVLCDYLNELGNFCLKEGVDLETDKAGAITPDWCPLKERLGESII